MILLAKLSKQDPCIWPPSCKEVGNPPVTAKQDFLCVVCFVSKGSLSEREPNLPSYNY